MVSCENKSFMVFNEDKTFICLSQGSSELMRKIAVNGKLRDYFYGNAKVNKVIFRPIHGIAYKITELTRYPLRKV